MDNRNLIHPMTAGDLVNSAVVLVQKDGRNHLLEVTGVDASGEYFLFVDFTDKETGEEIRMKIRPSVPLLVTGIFA